MSAPALQKLTTSTLKPGTGATETDPHRILEWLKNLPFANILEAGEQLASQLAALNRTRITLERRTVILEYFHATAGRARETLLHHQATVTSESARERAQGLHARLVQELAFGYKQALRQLAQTRGRIARDTDILCCQRAIYYLGLQMLTSYQSYVPASEHLWQEVVLLLDHAGTRNREAIDLPDPCTQSGSSSVIDSFKAIALLRLSDPYRLQPGWVWNLWEYIHDRADRIAFQPSIQKERPPGILPLNLPGESISPLTAGIDARPLIELASRHIVRLADGQQTTSLGLSSELKPTELLQLLQRAVGIWQGSAERSAPRFIDHAEIPVHIGLGNISSSDNSRSASTTAQRINRSRGGISLRFQIEAEHRLQVGQLISVPPLQATDGTQRVPAVIRWLIRRPDTGIDCGAQFIGTGLRQLSIRPYTPGSSGILLPAIMTPLKHKNRVTDTLLAPRGAYQEGKLLELVEGRDSFEVRCGRLIETTRLFERFTIKVNNR